MANDYSASINLTTAEAEKGVRNLGTAVSELDKKLASLDGTIRKTQGNLDTVTKSMSELTRANAVLIRSETDRAKATVQAARADRERIVNQGKLQRSANDTAIAEAKAARLRGQTDNAGRSTNASIANRTAESQLRISAQTSIAQQRLATENTRTAIATQNLAAATTRNNMATERGTQQTNRFASAQSGARNSSLALNDSLSNSRYLLYDVGQTYAVLSAALLSIPTATAQVAIAYEKDFAQVMRTNMDLENSGGSFATLRQELKELATEIPLTFEELSKISTIGGQLGIAGKDMGAFTETVARFGAASNVSLDEASTAFGRFRQSFKDGNTQDYFNKLGSAIALVGVKSVATEQQIVAVSNQIMAAGSQFGFTTKDIVGLSGALASVRIRPEMARGAFQRIMLGLSAAADEGAEAFETFGKYTGLAGDASIKLLKTDPSEFFYKYIGGIKQAISETGSVSAVLEDIGAKNVFDKQFILGLANGYDVFGESLANASKGFNEGTFLNKSTEGVFNTVDAKLKRISASIKNMGDTIAKGSLGGLAGVADVLLNVVGAADRFTQANKGFSTFVNLALGLGTAVGVLLAFKSAQAFVLAGLVGFQQVLGRTSIAAGLTLKGNMQELAKTMLMTKGVTAAASTEFIKNTGVMRAMSASAVLTTTQIRAMNAGLGTAGVTASASAARIGFFAGAVRGLSGALAFVGGPIGLMITAAALVGLAWMDAAGQVSNAADEMARAMANGEEAGKNGTASALAEIKVGAADGVIALGSLGKKFIEVARDANVPFEKLTEAALKGKDAGEAVNKLLDEVARSKGFADAAAVTKSLDPNAMALAAQFGFLRTKVREVGEQSVTARANVDDLKDVTGEAGAAAAGTVPDIEGLADSIGGVGDEADTAQEKIDKFIGAIFGIADAQSATQEALSSLGEGLVESGDFGNGTEGGRNNIANFRDTLKAAMMEQQYLIDSTGKTTQQASADYIAFVEGLVREMASRGVDTAQIQAMANQAKLYFGTTLASGTPVTMPVKAPAPEQIVATAGDVRNTIQAVLDNQPAQATIFADASQADAQMQGLAKSLAEISGIPYTVVLDALTNPANEKSKQVYDLLTSITNGTYVAPVNADTSAAITNVQNFLAYARTELAHLQTELNGGVGYGDGEGSLGTAQKAQYDALGAPQMVAAPAAAAPVIKTPQIQTAPSIPAPNFDGLKNGYADAAKAAEKAGEKGKKAGEDMANGIDEATRAADDYGNRLRQGLQSAFDKQYGLQAATDAYHTTLNSINKKREDEKKQLQDLIDKQKELNNERREDLVTARKAGIEKAISTKYGEVDRAADYASQEQTALDNAAAKQKDIDATKKQADELQAGIGKLDGYSQAAIDNRAALRDLESKMLDMIGAYADTGATQEQVRAYAIKLTDQFKKDVIQLGVNKGAVDKLKVGVQYYRDMVNSVPRIKPTKVEADTAAAKGKIDGIKSSLRGIPPVTNARVNVDKYTRNWYLGSVVKTPNTTKAGDPIYRVVRPDGTNTNNLLFNKGGQVPGFASGGQIPGRAPSNPGVDNLMAQVDGKGMVKVRSEEFIVQQPAVDYWGLDFMNAINNMKMPAFNGGGSVSGARGGSGSGDAMLVELTAENIAAIQRMPQVNLYADSVQLAKSVNDGNALLATQGAN